MTSSDRGAPFLLRSPLLSSLAGVRHLFVGKGASSDGAGLFPCGITAPLVQVHGTTILLLREGGPLPMEPVEADGAAAERPGISLRVFIADCVPLFLADTSGRRIALVHAGWRGTAAGIVSEALRRLEAMGAPPDSLAAWIGPAIGPCCYEVGEEVVRALGGDPPGAAGPNGSFRLDLPEAVRLRLLSGGMEPGRIDLSRICTRCNRDRLYSHRGDAGGGRNTAWITRVS